MRRLLLIIIGLILVLAIVGIITVGTSVGQLVSSLAGLGGATPVPKPTPTSIVRTGPLVVNAIRTHAKLETVVMNIVNDQDITRVSGVGGICTERITYLGYYDITAGIDLSKITQENIIVTNDGFLDQAVVTVTIPPAEIMNVVLDTEHSRVVAQQTPTWIPGCETQVADMAVEAQQIIRQYVEIAAIERGILQLAQEKAGFEVQRLLLETGYWNVNIQYTDTVKIQE